MPSDKDRLYVALYARGGKPTMPGLEDTYHWGLIIGPKKELADSEGSRYHAKEVIQNIGNQDAPVSQSVFQFEERGIPMAATAMLLVRIMIGKVKDKKRLESIFRNTPIQSRVTGWNCVFWVKEAIETAIADKKALGVPEGCTWQTIRDVAMWYIEKKKAAHRFDGKGDYDQRKAATWDMIEGIERIP
ncbi:hypothetical protein NLU13_0219 [Sarocladium strictum]|uniref:Uncharacterized protein n=1 Tax=Sarocladium strictum TaxID=5046 RepID=A0AA39GPE4_SARSR|nr:hypothetical protein NLU13_0219 [Sarocladium strictum]